MIPLITSVVFCFIYHGIFMHDKNNMDSVTSERAGNKLNTDTKHAEISASLGVETKSCIIRNTSPNVQIFVLEKETR